MKDPTNLDWARLAAYIDGEGCISIVEIRPTTKRPNTSFRLTVDISNTDPRLMQYLTLNFGGTTIADTRNPKAKKTCFRWAVVEQKAEKILIGALPYFVIKREQAEIALAYRRAIRNGRGSGFKLETSEIEARRSLSNRLKELKTLRFLGNTPDIESLSVN